MRRAVDLPQPEGPSSETNSPDLTSRSNSESATVPFANVFCTPRRETNGADEIGRSRVASMRRTQDNFNNPPGRWAGRRGLLLQIKPDTFVHELKRVSFLVIEIGLEQARFHHLAEEVLHAIIGHCADA